MFKNIGRKEDFIKKSVLGRDNYRIAWDPQPIIREVYDEEGEPTGETYEDPLFITWMQENFTSKPSIDEIKPIILDYINKKIDNKILNGFIWTAKDETKISVYLSSENQFNYKAAYDLAYQTDGQSLPFRLKFGPVDNPQYYDFTDMEEFGSFYLNCIGFINNTLQEGWQIKDSINWDEYDFDAEPNADENNRPDTE